MYRRARVRIYECDICGDTTELVPERHGYGPLTYRFPDGWKGSYRKNGACLCPRCAAAYDSAIATIGGDDDE